MTTNSQQLLREEFNLPKNEEIYDDFGCSVVQTVPISGRMYLTQNYLCFLSSILGINKKFTIHYKEVVQIKKKKMLGILDSGIEIGKSHGQEPVIFCSFQDRDMAYSRIKALWRNISPHAQKKNEYEYDQGDDGFNHQISEDENEFKDDNGDMIAPQKKNSDFYRINTASQLDAQKQYPIYGSVRLNTLPKALSMNHHHSQEDKSTQPNLLQQQDIPNESQRTKIEDSLGYKFNNLDDNLKNSSKLEGAQIFKSQTNINITNGHHINQDVTFSKSLNHGNMSTSPQKYHDSQISDQDLIAMLDKQYPIPSKEWIQLKTVAMPLTINQFYERFFADQAPFGFDVFSAKMDRKDIQLELWNNSSASTLDGKPCLDNKPQRWLRSILAVKGVPFLSQTRHQKHFKIDHNDQQSLVIEMQNKSLDIPYADCFYIEEKWWIISEKPNANKCVLRVAINIVFVKSTLFKSRITSKTQEGMKENIENWCKLAQEGGYLDNAEKQPVILNGYTDEQDNNGLFETDKKSQSYKLQNGSRERSYTQVEPRNKSERNKLFEKDIGGDSISPIRNSREAQQNCKKNQQK
eukprot:403351216